MSWRILLAGRDAAAPAPSSCHPSTSPRPVGRPPRRHTRSGAWTATCRTGHAPARGPPPRLPAGRPGPTPTAPPPPSRSPLDGSRPPTPCCGRSPRGTSRTQVIDILRRRPRPHPWPAGAGATCTLGVEGHGRRGPVRRRGPRALDRRLVHRRVPPRPCASTRTPAGATPSRAVKEQLRGAAARPEPRRPCAT
ncbi:hypothetical protein LT493_29685 [Streptomyces tricolor]|nr:hypothetical protein [Streptomyces tricolor]